jgi:hypothetical protein
VIAAREESGRPDSAGGAIIPGPAHLEINLGAAILCFVPDQSFEHGTRRLGASRDKRAYAEVNP